MSLRWPWAADVKHRFVLLSTFLVICALLNSAVAQTSKGILVGTVRDPDGAVLAGASLTVTSQETGETRHVTSDAQGDFRIEAISPGVYSIHAEAPGFEAVDVKHLTIVPSAVTSYQPVLQLEKPPLPLRLKRPAIKSIPKMPRFQKPLARLS